MAATITRSQFVRVAVALKSGASMREAARKAGTSHHTVSAIVHRKHPFTRPPPTPRRRYEGESARAAEKCPRCGAVLVESPCRACWLRSAAATESFGGPLPDPSGLDPIGLELKPIHYARYQKVRRDRGLPDLSNEDATP